MRASKSRNGRLVYKALKIIVRTRGVNIQDSSVKTVSSYD